VPLVKAGNTALELDCDEAESEVALEVDWDEEEVVELRVLTSTAMAPDSATKATTRTTITRVAVLPLPELPPGLPAGIKSGGLSRKPVLRIPLARLNPVARRF